MVFFYYHFNIVNKANNDVFVKVQLDRFDMQDLKLDYFEPWFAFKTTLFSNQQMHSEIAES